MATQIQDKVSRQPAVADIDGRDAMIAEAAYFRAERRGFEAGHELEDWLAAEDEIDCLPYGDLSDR